MSVIINFPKMYTDGIDPSDATAIAEDIIAGKTAYIGEGKVEGTLTANAEDIRWGATINGVEGTFTQETEDDASASNVLKGKTFAVKGRTVTGTMESVEIKDKVVPTVEDQTVTEANKYVRSYPIIVAGDENLVASNIKKDVTIFGVTGTYEGSGGSVEYGLLDTSSFTSKQDTYDAYGTEVYIYESTGTAHSFDTNLNSLKAVVDYWGGVSSQNNFIGDSFQEYGILVGNWSEQNASDGVLFLDPIVFPNSKSLLSYKYYCSSWMNVTMGIHLIKSTGTTTEEIVADVLSAIDSSTYDISASVYCPGSMSMTDCSALLSITPDPNATYYMYIDGTKKSQNDNFTYVKMSLLNF